MGDYRPKIEQRIVQQLARCSLVLLLVLFQTALAPSLWGFRVNWVLVAAVCWTLVRGFAGGIQWAIYGGLLLDMLSPLPVGSHLLALLLAVTCTAVATGGLPPDNRLVPTALILTVSLVYALVLGTIMSATGRPIAWQRYPLTIILPEGLANAAMALPVYLALERLQRSVFSRAKIEL